MGTERAGRTEAVGDRTARDRRVWAPRGLAADAVLALAVIAFEIVGTVLTSNQPPGSQPLDAVAYALIAASAGSLVARRRYPTLVLLTTIVLTLAYYPLGYPEGPVYLAVLVALYSAAAAGRRLQAIAVMVAAFLLVYLTAFLLVSTKQMTVGDLVAAAGSVAAVLVGGEVARSRRAHLHAVEERAAQAERTREEEARRRADEERLRIARELHDVLAHNISMMNVQAGVAAHLLDERPEQARGALLAIKDVSKDALRELRATLGTLRQADEGEEAPRAPAPNLGLLGELAAQTTAAGLPVDVRTEGEPRKLPPGVDRAVYRIVQEALTNVTRHGGRATAVVQVTYGDRDLLVQVDDDGDAGDAGGATAPAGGGNGIVGMRERAHSLGGELEAGPRDEGGFRVRARLPLDGQPGEYPAAGGPPSEESAPAGRAPQSEGRSERAGRHHQKDGVAP